MTQLKIKIKFKRGIKNLSGNPEFHEENYSERMKNDR